MGSLMAGWDSKDPKAVMCQRNKSLTKEVIAAYWKSAKKNEEVNHTADSGVVNENQENMHKVSAQKMQRSNTVPLTDKRESNGSKIDAEKMSKINCWWTRSNSAFLNEPPVMAAEGPQKYTAQFHVADFVNPKIST